MSSSCFSSISRVTVNIRLQYGGNEAQEVFGAVDIVWVDRLHL